MSDKINVVILDTYGEVETSGKHTKDRFPFVAGWGAYDPRPVKSHPHGSQVAEKILVPLYDEGNVHVHFIRIFDERTRFIGLTPAMWDYLYEVAKSGFTVVNNSWGGYVGDSPPTAYHRNMADQWRSFIASTGSVVVWAAGNGGDYRPGCNNDMPQALLGDVSFRIGSIDQTTRTSEFSGDSESAPPACVLWGENVILYDGARNTFSRGHGTSFSAPRFAGIVAKKRLDYTTALELVESRAIYPQELKEMRPHPKWGYGTLEHVYQDLIRESPYLFSASSDGMRVSHHIKDTAVLDNTIEYYDFREVTK